WLPPASATKRSRTALGIGPPPTITRCPRAAPELEVADAVEGVAGDDAHAAVHRRSAAASARPPDARQSFPMSVLLTRGHPGGERLAGYTILNRARRAAPKRLCWICPS